MMYIYIVSQSDDVCKVGISSNVEKRIVSLQTGNPHQLSLKYSYILETTTARILENRVHVKLNEKRLTGEWFNITPKDAEKIIMEENQAIIDGDELDDDVFIEEVEEFEEALNNIISFLRKDEEKGIDEDLALRSADYVETVISMPIDFRSIDREVERIKQE